MIPSYTQEQLIKLIYNECSADEKRILHVMISEDAGVAEEYAQLKNIFCELNKAHYEPTATSIHIIIQQLQAELQH